MGAYEQVPENGIVIAMPVVVYRQMAGAVDLEQEEASKIDAILVEAGMFAEAAWRSDRDAEPEVPAGAWSGARARTRCRDRRTWS